MPHESSRWLAATCMTSKPGLNYTHNHFSALGLAQKQKLIETSWGKTWLKETEARASIQGNMEYAFSCSVQQSSN